MGKEYNDLKKEATRFLLKKFADGKKYNENDIKKILLFDYGLGQPFYKEFMQIFGDRLEEQDGLYTWRDI